MEMGKRKKEAVLSIIDLLVVVFLLSCMVGFILSARSYDLSYPVADGWMVSVTGEGTSSTEENVDLRTYRFPLGTGSISEAEFTRLIPASMLDSATLRIYSMISDIEVRLGNRVVFNSQKDNDRFLEMSRGYTFVELPHCDKSEVLSIRFLATDDRGLALVPNIELTDSGKAYPFFVHERWFSVIISFFMFVFGLVVTILSVVFVRLNDDYKRLMHIGLFSVFAGIWLMSMEDVLLLFGISADRSSGAGYLAISMAFLPLLSLDLLSRKNMSKKDEKLVIFVIRINMLTAFFTACLHFSGLISYVVSVPLIHTVIIIDCIILVFAGAGSIKDMELDERIYHYGMIYIVIMGFGYIALYDLRVYARVIPMRYNESWFPVVVFSFIIVLIIGYLVHLYGMLLNQAEEEVLTRLAYNDALTGLYNRVKAEEEFKRLDASDEAYAFVNLDLNGLKKVNDKLGHARGDEFISTFGDILKEVFSKAGSCIRMGGDEFLVIIKEGFVDQTDELIARLLECEKRESKNTSFDIDSSYGVSKSSEMVHPVAEQLFSLADERMYAQKIASKKGRED